MCGPLYQYVGHVHNTSSWVAFELLIADEKNKPLYLVKQDKTRKWFAGNDYLVKLHANTKHKILLACAIFR